ncbi:MAG: serine/threonine-protein phosphatase [Chloroflexi bacterium]|nr:MAG: serine/threonine-protein phosphatase [Chloroflexota bacterium]
MTRRPPDRDDELDALTSELIEVQDQLLAIYELAQVMRGQLEPEPLLDALVGEAGKLVRAEGGFAALEPAAGVPLLVRSPGSPLDLPGERELARAFGTGLAPAVSALLDGRRVLMVPIPLRTRPSGVLGLVSPPGSGFDMPKQKLATALAALAGAQLEGVLLYQETLRRTRVELEFELARWVQAGLTPPPPACVPGLDVFAESRAALAVGGDFFDFHTRHDGRLVCVLGDVAGKGVPAALLVAMARASIRTASRDPASDPAAVLGAANAELGEDFGRLGLFATVFIARVEPGAASLLVANAGHSPVVYRPAGGTARLVRAQAPPLGILPEWGDASRSLRLGRDDMLVAATDGFSEAEREGTGELFGYDRVLDLTERCAGLSAAEVAAAFFAATDEFSAGVPGDDRTVLVLRGV